MDDEIIEELVSITGKDWIVEGSERIAGYLYDATPKPVSPEAINDVVVAKPKEVGEISEIMDLANKESITVIPRGGGTGVVGAAIPTNPGPSLILSLERLDEIVEIDEDNLMITCEAGVTLESLLEAVSKTDHLFFPPHPGDEGAQIGGMAVENAGGARAVKYGVMRNYVKGMEVILPTGERLELGGKLLKNNTGYDLMHLLMGSEGTLGIITKVTLRLYPKAQETATLIVPFKTQHDAINSVPRILREGYLPLALEYVERRGVEESAEHLGKSWPAGEGEAFLLLIITGKGEDEIFDKTEAIIEILKENKALEPLLAQRRKEQENILDIRSNITTAREEDVLDSLDVTVPPARLGELLDKIDELAEEYGTTINVYGHAADGNLHPDIMRDNEEVPKKLEELKDKIYQETLDLGGVITGEHGIGEIRLKNLPMALCDKEIDLMNEIKEVFDPNSILNPGKAVS